MLRFVNDYDQNNLEPLYLPYKNKWRVYYKTNLFVK